MKTSAEQMLGWLQVGQRYQETFQDWLKMEDIRVLWFHSQYFHYHHEGFQCQKNSYCESLLQKYRWSLSLVEQYSIKNRGGLLKFPLPIFCCKVLITRSTGVKVEFVLV